MRTIELFEDVMLNEINPTFLNKFLAISIIEISELKHTRIMEPIALKAGTHTPLIDHIFESRKPVITRAIFNEFPKLSDVTFDIVYRFWEKFTKLLIYRLNKLTVLDYKQGIKDRDRVSEMIGCLFKVQDKLTLTFGKEIKLHSIELASITYLPDNFIELDNFMRGMVFLALHDEGFNTSISLYITIAVQSFIADSIVELANHNYDYVQMKINIKSLFQNEHDEFAHSLVKNITSITDELVTDILNKLDLYEGYDDSNLISFIRDIVNIINESQILLIDSSIYGKSFNSSSYIVRLIHMLEQVFHKIGQCEWYGVQQSHAISIVIYFTFFNRTLHSLCSKRFVDRNEQHKLLFYVYRMNITIVHLLRSGIYNNIISNLYTFYHTGDTDLIKHLLPILMNRFTSFFEIDDTGFDDIHEATLAILKATLIHVFIDQGDIEIPIF
jgi:hypothetical protein